MQLKTVIIPAAGRGSRLGKLTDLYPKPMMPYNHKPIIDTLINQYKDDFDIIVIVVGYKKEKIISYVNEHFDDLDIRFIEQKELNGLATSVELGLSVLLEDELRNSLITVQLGDVIVPSVYPNGNNLLYASTVKDWQRWCMVKTNEYDYVEEFIDKPVDKPNTNKNLIGVYQFRDGYDLRYALDTAKASSNSNTGEYELSDALAIYNNMNGLGVEVVDEYIDLGEVDKFNFINDNISRSFNNIEISERGTVIKTSTNKGKLGQEFNWYKTAPELIKKYLPKLYDALPEHNGYELERINATQLQDMMMFKHTDYQTWEKVFANIREYLRTTIFVGEQVENFNIRQDNIKMLVNKLTERTIDLVEDFPYKEYTINNILYKNPLYHIDELVSVIEDKIINNRELKPVNALLHGDLFFGNMMFDEKTDELKLIDPRGKYGDTMQYGDIRYDIAKLNHSINYEYDFIVNDLFSFDIDYSKIDYIVYSGNLQEMRYLFNEMCDSLNIDYDTTELITGLLFITMIPLHEDSYPHQVMQFAKASEILNRFI